MASLDEMLNLGRVRQWWVSLVGIVIALFGVLLLDIVISEPSTVEGPVQWVFFIGPHWLVLGVVVAVVLWAERRPLTSIGLTWPTLYDLGWGVVGFVVGVLMIGISWPLMEMLGLSTTGSGIQMFTSLPVGIVIALAVSAGITEEVMYRGYPIERLAELTGSIWVGGALTFIVFTAAHVPLWGLGGTLQIGIFTVVVTILYIRLRNLPACILMHICNDLFAFVLLPYLL